MFKQIQLSYSFDALEPHIDAKQRAAQIRMDRNDANAGPGDPYPFEGRTKIS